MLSTSLHCLFGKLLKTILKKNGWHSSDLKDWPLLYNGATNDLSSIVTESFMAPNKGDVLHFSSAGPQVILMWRIIPTICSTCSLRGCVWLFWGAGCSLHCTCPFISYCLVSVPSVKYCSTSEDDSSLVPIKRSPYEDIQSCTQANLAANKHNKSGATSPLDTGEILISSTCKWKIKKSLHFPLFKASVDWRFNCWHGSWSVRVWRDGEPGYILFLFIASPLCHLQHKTTPDRGGYL